MPIDPENLPTNIQQIDWNGKPTLVAAGAVNVTLKPGVSSPPDDVLAGFGLAQPPIWIPLYDRTYQLVVAPSTNLEALLRVVSQSPHVEEAEPDFIQTAMRTPDDPFFGRQWAHQKIASEAAWDIEIGSRSVLIAMVDSGISMSKAGRLDHPDLMSSRYVIGPNLVTDGPPRDTTGHGTLMTGIAAASTDNCTGVAGVNWVSDVFICRCLDDNDYCPVSRTRKAFEAVLAFAQGKGLKVVINYSIGGYEDSRILIQACELVDRPDVLLVCAAGNKPNPVAFPAAYTRVFDRLVAVGATDDEDCVRGSSARGVELTLVAPGADIYSTSPYEFLPFMGVQRFYDRCAGTSASAAFVTGVASLIWSKRPELDSKDVKKILRDSAHRLEAGKTFSRDWGYGRLNAAVALRTAARHASQEIPIHKEH